MRLRALTAGGDHHDIEPAWSRDGRSLAFSTTGFDNRSYDLAVVAEAGDAPRRVTDDLAEDGRPAWSADGRSLFFNSRREGTQAVFRTWLESGRVDRVSPRGERALMPSAAPDGKRLAYVAASTAGLHAVVRDLDTGATEWTSPAEAADPRWSPDGARLAYVRVWPGGSALEVMTRATGALESMTVDGVAALREPAWSPDGRWLAAAAAASTGAERRLGPPGARPGRTYGGENHRRRWHRSVADLDGTVTPGWHAVLAKAGPAAVVAAAAVYVAARAALVPLTYDEAISVARFAAGDVLNLADFATAVNHQLNSVLLRLSAIAFGTAPWAVRLPNVAAGVVYGLCAAALMARVRHLVHRLGRSGAAHRPAVPARVLRPRARLRSGRGAVHRARCWRWSDGMPRRRAVAATPWPAGLRDWPAGPSSPATPRCRPAWRCWPS